MNLGGSLHSRRWVRVFKGVRERREAWGRCFLPLMRAPSTRASFTVQRMLRWLLKWEEKYGTFFCAAKLSQRITEPAVFIWEVALQSNMIYWYSIGALYWNDNICHFGLLFYYFGLDNICTNQKLDKEKDGKCGKMAQCWVSLLPTDHDWSSS